MAKFIFVQGSQYKKGRCTTAHLTACTILQAKSWKQARDPESLDFHIKTYQNQAATCQTGQQCQACACVILSSWVSQGIVI